MSDTPIDKSVRRVYQRDLYDEFYSVNVRVESEKIQDGDQLLITVERVGESDNRATEDDSDATEGKDLDESSE